MKTFGYYLVLVLVLVSALAVVAHAETTLEKVQRSGVLVVGVKDDAPPFAFKEKDSGHIVGYDVDFVTAIAARLKVRLELRPVTEASRTPELLEGKIDLIAANLSHSETRNAVLDFSDGYLTTGQKLIARAGTVNRHDDLRGKKIGAVVGTYSEICTREVCTASQVVAFDDYVGGIKALREGAIYAFAADEAILVDLFSALPQSEYEIPDLLIVSEEYHLGLRRGEKDFLNAVNGALRAAQQSGEAGKIRERWFAPRGERKPAAYGTIVRRAATPPRFLGVALSGILHSKAQISIFGLDGQRIGSGTISNIIADEFYVDVEERIYDFVRPGFLVTMNMTNEMAMDVLMRRGDVLKTVKADSEKQEEQLRSEISREAAAKSQRAVEADALREQNRLSTLRDRALYYGGYGAYRYR